MAHASGRTIHFTLLLFILLTAAACQPPPEPEPLDLRTPWQHGEVSQLSMIQNGEDVGTLILAVEAVDEGWTLITRRDGTAATEDARVTVASGSLVPTITDFESQQAGGTLTMRAVFGDEQVHVTQQDPNRSTDRQIRLPQQYFDNEQIFFLVRSLPLEEAWRGTAYIIVTRSGQHGPMTFVVVGRETVTTPAGEFDAWKVHFDRMGQDVWVEVDPPHRLVRYEAQGGRTVNVLDAYEAGSPADAGDNTAGAGGSPE